MIRPSSQRHLAQARYDDSIVGRSKEEASTLSAPLRRKLCSSALNSLRNNNDAGAFMVQFEFFKGSSALANQITRSQWEDWKRMCVGGRLSKIILF